MDWASGAKNALLQRTMLLISGKVMVCSIRAVSSLPERCLLWLQATADGCIGSGHRVRCWRVEPRQSSVLHPKSEERFSMDEVFESGGRV